MKSINMYLFLLIGMGKVFAGSYFVSIDGSNSASGTLKSPWASVQFAINHAGPGDSVWVKQGIYQETLQMMTQSGTEEKPIVIRNYPGDSVTIQSVTARGSDPALKITVSHVQVKGLTIHKTTRSAGPLNVYAGTHIVLDSLEIVGPGSWDAVSITNTKGETGYVTLSNSKIHTALHEGIYVRSENANRLHHISILNNEIYDCPDEAIQISASYYPSNPPEEILIKGNDIHDVGAWAIIHLYYAPKGVVIEDNFIHKNVTPWVGIHLDGAETTIQNNIFSHNSGSMASDDFACVRVTSSHGDPSFKIINNTFGITTRGNAKGAYGVWLGSGSTSQSDTICNNIFYENEDAGLLSQNRPLCSIKNNLFYRSDSGVVVNLAYSKYLGPKETPYLGDGNFFADPLFVDADSLNYHLKPESPAIDAGLNVDLKTDYTGAFRLMNQKIDLGAIEYPVEMVPEAPQNIRIIHDQE